LYRVKESCQKIAIIGAAVSEMFYMSQKQKRPLKEAFHSFGSGGVICSAPTVMQQIRLK